MYAVIDGMLERISNLISELDHRLQDGSILNADVPAYVRRLNASIQNLYRVLPHVRNPDRRGDERIMLWLSTLRNYLEIGTLDDSAFQSYTPPRVYTG